MQFMALCMLVIALPLGKRIPFFLPFGLMAAGLALMVSMLAIEGHAYMIPRKPKRP